MGCRGPLVPAGCRAEPCWEREGKAFTREAKPTEQDEPRKAKRSGESRHSKGSEASIPSSSTTAACGELCG